MDKLTQDEIKLLHDFIGQLSYYETMNILSRLYPDDELETKRRLLSSIWLKLGKS